MTQTRKNSFLEALTNTVVGFVVGVALNYFLLPLYGWHATVGESTSLTVIFTAATMLRSYLLRRLFNRPGERFYDGMRFAPEQYDFSRKLVKHVIKRTEFGELYTMLPPGSTHCDYCGLSLETCVCGDFLSAYSNDHRT